MFFSLHHKQTGFLEVITPDALWVQYFGGVMNFTVSVSDKNSAFALHLCLY